MSKHACNLLTVGITLFAAICTAGCTTEEVALNTDNMVYVNLTSLDLYFGDTQQLTASPTEGVFQWTSEDPSIATVDNTGLVTATGVGTTQIFAAQGEWSKSVDVVVSLPTAKTVSARAGDKRVLLEVTIENDRVQKMKVACTETGSSIEQDVNYQSGVFQFYYNDLEENQQYNFSVACVDKFGNESTPVTASAKAYGDSFRATLGSRNVDVATCFGNGLVVRWKNISGNCMLSYTNNKGEAVKKYILASETNSYLLDFGYGSELSYSTYAVPEINAADTFYVAPTLANYEDLHTVIKSSEPCEVRVFNFDLGGEGVGYHDNSGHNEAGNNYRSGKGDNNSEGPDLEHGGNIGYTGEGEWQMFTVYVQDAGTYAFDLHRSVNNGNGGYYALEVDGVQTAYVYMQNDNDWSAYKWQHEVYPENQLKLNLTAGRHTVKFMVGSGGNFNYNLIRFTYQ